MTVKAQEHIEIIANELSHAYEELVLLHKLSTNMSVAEPDSNYLQMACDSLTDIVSVEGIAILQQDSAPEQNRLVLTAGSGLIDIDDRMITVLYTHLAQEINNGKDALLDSDVDSPLRYDWPGNIRSIIAVPLCGKEKPADTFAQRTQISNRIIGLLVAVNRIDRPDFDSTDVKLFNSVANGCAVFIENGRLFKDLEELFIGSLKALTSSIDAKDQYTRGHSERVAFVSRWISENLVNAGLLDHAQMHKAYLAGLLHDIGKMGINEAVLRKEGKLSAEELNHMRTHPAIGAAILSEIKQMHEIIPGILCHHERVDGTGYPNGLFAHQIPLLGKIIGLADSFDAMTSKRTYRNALTVEQAIREITDRLGTQFDTEIATVFLNSDVYKLWTAMQDGPIGVYDKGNFSEYGMAAVGALIG